MDNGAIYAGKSSKYYLCLPVLLLTREDVDFVKKHGLRKAFLTGSNTSCRNHIRQHYEYYHQKCKELGISENWRCVPEDVMEERESGNKRKQLQSRLDVHMVKSTAPTEFKPEVTLQKIAEMIVAGNLVSDRMINFENYINLDLRRFCLSTAPRLIMFSFRSAPRPRKATYQPRQQLKHISTTRQSNG
jgi:hypothetical protein